MLTVEAVHIANQLCQYGYFFPVNDSKTLTVRDDSSLYRFQVPYLSLLRLTIESKFETGIYYHHHLYYTYIMYICICITLYKCYEKKYEKSFPIWSKTHSESDLYYYDIIRIVFSRIIYRCIESIFFFFSNFSTLDRFFDRSDSKRNIINIIFTVFLIEKLI